VNSLELRGRKYWLPAYASSGDRLFIASLDRPNLLYVASGGNPPAPLAILPTGWGVSSLAAWQSGVLVGMHDHGGRLLAYDLNSNSPAIDTFPVNEERENPFESASLGITALGVPAGESWLAIGTIAGHVWILDANSLRVIKQRPPLSDPPLWRAPVRSMAASPQGFVVAGANDGKLALIELEL
jgi:hypothetical protein